MSIPGNEAEKKKSEIIKKLQNFGFEVGYYNHFELGWVLKKYNELITDARNQGIKSPEYYYNDGKIKGKANRGQVLDGDKISQNEPEIDIGIKGELINESKINITEIIKPPNKIIATPFLDRPKLDDLPKMFEKNKTTELPELLRGMKLLKRM